MITPDRIGHLVLKIRDLDRSLEFYRDVLGLTVMNRCNMGGVNVAFLASNGRDHHELALLEVGPEAPAAEPASIGLAHFAFRLSSQEALVAAYQQLKDAGVTVHFTVNHGVTNSVYFFDPDGNELEVYADNPADVYGAMENPYMGVDKLPFAPNDASILDALAAI